MDTRFWGPSGWQLLHTIAASPVADPVAVKQWFGLLEYVLPCKYCRASFHDYMRREPLTAAIVSDTDRFSHWMYDIHNMVNNKLRGQRLLKTPNPPWHVIRDRYRVGSFVGWDFFTAVAFTTPGPDVASKPLPGGRQATTIAERNRYNRLTCGERRRFLRRWWALIPSILPSAEWRRAWKAAVTASASTVAVAPVDGGRRAMMPWLWSLEESVCAQLQCEKPHESLPHLETVCSAFESSCGTARKGNTCRTRKRRLRHLLTRRR